MNQSFNSPSGPQKCDRDCNVTDITPADPNHAVVHSAVLGKERAYVYFNCYLAERSRELAKASDSDTELVVFDPQGDWEAFVKYCTPGNAIRIQFATLIGCLCAHRDRFAERDGLPSESDLVCWALDRMGSPMSDFLWWSLAREEGPKKYWTIDSLEEHMTLWSNVFDSGPAKEYEEHVIRLTSSLYPHQNATNGSFIVHAFSSDFKHTRRAFQLWKIFWHKHFEYAANSHQPSDVEMTDAP
ncbi:uncharacterized protein Z520_04062 [Fonsecaea multimorphosa CBS 102226]|uniref:Uncharacterized protein n=1 Tax=Fonsecaea multimorphosa CBS 102226 TaxID=1442371 RepID=A0A0D2ITT8_9EURO|nr:uncharacterized protein Z520_04062 [Fonsecaea multimorphosa CBS 102226]KIY00377.1 hypothetical protein Z520_04062 [Fonsecaea multimorphosa CBS 102226]OAL27208.1 hypothetical protein AYO22_03839 [Fonsecaea multimorphosa]